ncbi:hypothetical protein [Legionella septentrionalis]|uniref:hypothetical protein n=1 Tax=Legionella septentrionalis TaxID=2498109 RepID=UPI000F8ED155|nr:hypothetical protein [Legionella septentrionalis]RUR10312.1 hypothetical protein ELY14_05420 [Legionella septentrionalis]
MKKFRSNYFILLFLALVFLAPGIFAYFFYTHPDWLGGKKTNRGELLNPPQLLAHENKNAKWRLILWSPGTCETACMQQLDKLARSRLALGRRLYEVETWLWLGASAPEISLAQNQILQDEEIYKRRLKADDKVNLPPTSLIYLQNPAGYLVMSYETSAKPADIFHDVKRLLNTKE